MKNLLIFGVIILVGWWLLSGDSSSEYSGSSYSSYESEEKTMDRYDALSDNWDEISEYLDGTYTVEACSGNSGNCYSLDADISSGEIETIYFSNGGYLSVSAEVDSDGEAEGYDDSDEGDSWTFQVDESDIDEALEEWADNNDITIE